MDRSPTRFRQRALAAALVAFFSARAELRAAAQDETPPAQPAPASTTTALPPPTDPVREQELARLYAQLERQRAKNRRWQDPTIGLALGFVTLFTGAMLFVDSAGNPADSSCYEEAEECGDNDRKFLAGVVLMMIGAPTILVSVPMLVVRTKRESRFQATKAAIRRLGGQFSLAPLLRPRGEVGLGLHARF